MRTLPLLAAVLLLCACAEPPAEVPDTVGELDLDLGDLSVWLFAHLNDDNVDQLGVGARDLRNLLLDQDAALNDYDDREARTWALPHLDGDNLNVDVWPGADPDLQLPVGVGYRSRHSMDDHGRALVLADQTPVEAASSAAYDRVFDSDPTCFVEGTCDALTGADTIHRVNALLDLVYVQQKEYRRVPVYEEEGDMVFWRSWTTQQYREEPPNSDTIDQWTGLTVNLTDGDETLRFAALWGSSNLALQDSYLISQVADGMEEGFVATDLWLDEN
jgi:hypothetical protein